MTCAATLTLVVFNLAGAPPEITNAVELEKVVIAARQKIRNGSFDVTCATTASKSARRESGVRCAFDFDHGDSIRLEWSQDAPNFTRGGKAVKIVSNDGKWVDLVIVSGSRVMMWSPNEFSDGSRRAAVMTDRKTKLKPMFFDPRVFGMTAKSYSLIAHARFEDVFHRKQLDLAQTPVMKDVVDGKPVLKVEYEEEPLRQRIWVAPDENFSVVFTETTFRNDRTTMVWAVTCQNRHFEREGIWFPEIIRCSRTVDGKIDTDEKTVIQNAKFNEGVEASSFTLRGLGMPKGTRVVDETGPNVKLEWDGEQLIQSDDAPPMP